jgi:hypothetical protein
MVTLVNSENGRGVECTGLWAEHSGDELVYGFENTVNHVAYDLEPEALRFEGYGDWPWPTDADDPEVATLHRVLEPWRVLVE